MGLAHPPSSAPNNSDQSYDTYHVQGLAATNHTQHPGTGNHYGQYPIHSNVHHSGAQDSGYQSLATTPGPTLCTVWGNYLTWNLSFLRRPWRDRSAI
jgi:hypothetical protein